MLEILQACWALVVGLLASVWGVIALFATWGWEVLYHLHVSAPRLEGLLIGIVLAWVLLRRDKHPLLRVLSSPLKLIVDILDLAWDQVVEVVRDVWDTSIDWTTRPINWCKSKVTDGLSWVMSGLRSLKDRLAKKKDEE